MSAVIAILAAVSIYGTSIEDLRREFPHASTDDAIVADAIEREIAFSAVGSLGEASIRENVIPIVVHFAAERCVVLRWPAGALGGGSPIFCYQKASDLYLYSYQDGSQ